MKVNDATAKQAKQQWPLNLIINGLEVKIYRLINPAKNVEFFRVVYVENGVRKLINRNSLEAAKAAANEATIKASNNQAPPSTILVNGEQFAYLRAKETAAKIGKPLDVVCSEYADAAAILAGRNISILEVARDWAARNSAGQVKINIADAVAQCKAQAAADGKSDDRQTQLRVALDRLAETFNGVTVDTINPAQISEYLTNLKDKAGKEALGERSKKNHRDIIGYFCRWCVLKKYLAKGTDWLEGVQNYSMRKIGEIEIFTPEEMQKLLSDGNGMTPFLAIAAFSGIRHREICRLTWDDIDLADNFITVHAKISKTGERRLVPIRENLRAWLLKVRKTSGKVVTYGNANNQLLKVANKLGVKWKRNALRHSYVSYRMAEIADVGRVADESGNSPTVIRQNYLRRVKPAQAAEWFSINPK